MIKDNYNDPFQLAFDLCHPPRFSRKDLVVSSSNQEAVRLIDSWPHWPTTITLLVGPAGSGKSHLAAIWHSLSLAIPIHSYAITKNFPKKGPFLLEDADLGNIDEVGLFHLINYVQQMHSHLLITARRLPLAWGTLLPDLSSRLKAATLVEIQQPDEKLLSSVLEKLFLDRQINIAPHIIDYLVCRIERSLSTAIYVVDHLDKVALARKVRITRSLAAEIIDSLEEQKTKGLEKEHPLLSE